ncbi:hypothetical protein [Flavobacterium sp. NRK1]|uniref:hypothetical protein n=1 Tax=Flavobacterium sp. NRK1 TaxID=2954929 RepID=UPI0020925922|nr:hypothetical protein [Flavobacterium sp. NRK1]MCO6146595.1 hypothetical protein [Flavobacterium sp. NRK1]
MENETPEITDKTFTVNSENSYFNSTGLCLNILLPAATTENPYVFKYFDVSQIIDGKHKNAVFIYLKKHTDNGTDISGDDDDKTECGCVFTHSQMLPVDTQAGYSAFDHTKKDNALVVIYHDNSEDEDDWFTCAEKVFVEVKTLWNNAISNGNFQDSTCLIGETPKKRGTSFVPHN